MSDLQKASKPPLVSRDADIRRALLAALGEKFKDKGHDLIVEEFGCKSARVDVAVINGALHGFEIKSDSDSLDRLPGQIAAYQSVFELVTLVCGRRLLDRARLVIPKWWGLQKAEFRDGSIVLRELRTPKPNPKLCPSALAKMLWKTEALAVLRKHGHKVVTSKCSADEVWRATATSLSLETLIQEVRDAIRKRGGSGFAMPSSLDDDWCTIESTVQQSRSTGLSWLLSPQFAHLLD